MSNGALERLWKLETQVDRLVLEGLRDPDIVSAALQEILEERRAEKSKFSLLADLGTFTVPEGFKHDDLPAPFGNRFPNPTRVLNPGDKLHVRAFKQVVPGTTTSEERLAFLRQQSGNQFVGAQGVVLVRQQKSGQLLKGYWYDSFDEPDRLWEDADGCRRVPRVGAGGGGGFDFDRFERVWDGSSVLLCFRDLPEQSSGA